MVARTMGSRGNLTLDEVQHQLGKPLSTNSMNLDDLINNTVETQRIIINNQPASASSSSSSMLDFTNKTVDQLWQDINKEEDSNNSSSSNDNTKQPPTLGEMTLEDFLAKAGILSQDKTSTESVELSSQQNYKQQLAQWMQYQIQPFQQPVFMPDHQIVSDIAYSEAQVTVSSDTQTTPGRKRAASGGDLLEKTIERRQKRMIKNRESAARSRARKQAYTDALENKVSHLEEENERLKREQEAEKALPYVPPSEPKYQLRRTSSTSF